MSSSPHTSRGKWSVPGVPHRGWTCVGVEDLGEPARVCQMCESVVVRYVHTMEHPDYPETLAVGRVCAEHMETDYAAPRLREERLRMHSRRRISWPKKQWRVSAKGNHYLNTEGFNLTVFSQASLKERHWKILVRHRNSGAKQYGRRTFASETEAKQAALDALLWAKDNLPKRN